MTLKSEHVHGVLWLSQRLRDINKLGIPEQNNEILEAVRTLNGELDGTHLYCTWNTDEEVWTINHRGDE